MSARRILLRILVLSAALTVPFAPSSVLGAQTRAFVFATDYTTGILSVVDLDTRAVTRNVSAGVCSDVRLRWFGGFLYVINRSCNNILVLDPSNGFGLVRQFSTGPGSNPSDIVLVSATKAYVPCYDLGTMLIVNPASGASLGQISFAPYADADGIPEMDHAIRLGDRVFVTLQRLDRNNNYQPTGLSLAAVIDATTDAIVDVDPGTSGIQCIRLTGQNPFTSIAYDAATQRLLVACVGSFGALDGGVEWIDPVTLRSDGYAITESALGGNLSDFTWNGAAHSYAVISDPAFNTGLVSWSSTSGTRLATIYGTNGFQLADADLDDRGELYLCRNLPLTYPRLYVFSAPGGDALVDSLGTGLPPNQITFDEVSNVTGVSMPAPVSRILPPIPNPARHEARFGFVLARPGRLAFEIFDLTGRSVRKIVDEVRGSGSGEVRWDLRDASGRRVCPGIYLVRASTFENSVKISDGNFLVSRLIVIY